MSESSQTPAGGGGRGRSHRSRHSQGKRGRRSGGGGRNSRVAGIGTQYLQPDPEPLPALDNSGPRIFAFVDDMFFLAKITETARKLNVRVDFVKTDKEVLERIGQNGDQKPSLVIVDLNNTSARPLTVVSRLKSKLKKKTTIIGFLSHLQGDLKVKAGEAGCDMVLPRSAFSQNLPQLLRRHGAPDEVEDVEATAPPAALADSPSGVAEVSRAAPLESPTEASSEEVLEGFES